MMRSLFSGVSGLRNHQVQMDVIGNNIANVNTVGFKASRVTFEEAYAQIVQGARPPGSDSNESGLNPTQVGLGMNIGSIDLLFTQGNLEATGVETDLAIGDEGLGSVGHHGENLLRKRGFTGGREEENGGDVGGGKESDQERSERRRWSDERQLHSSQIRAERDAVEPCGQGPRG